LKAAEIGVLPADFSRFQKVNFGFLKMALFVLIKSPTLLRRFCCSWVFWEKFSLLNVPFEVLGGFVMKESIQEHRIFA